MRLLKLDEFAISRHLDLKTDDECYYWREYTPDTNYSASATNQLIHNFKISPLDTKKERAYYKAEAINQIAKEFVQVIKREETYKTFAFVPVPPSKASAQYDNRLIQVLEKVSNLKNIKLDIRPVISQRKDTEAAHLSNKRLSIDQLYKLYAVNSALINPIPEKVFIFDDVLSKGTHFKAMQKMLKEIWSSTHIIGLFIARSVLDHSLS